MDAHFANQDARSKQYIKGGGEMKINKYIVPDTLHEAYTLLTNTNAAIIGGGLFLKMNNKEVDFGIDLSELNLNFIVEKEDSVEIGSYTTLRDIETNEIIKSMFNGVINNTCSEIYSIQVRNMATIGGSICGKFGFSDIITTLCSLDTYLEFYNIGRMSINEYLKLGNIKDILLKIIIMKQPIAKGSFKSVRLISTDFAILNVCCTKAENNFNIIVGARPGTPIRAKKCEGFLGSLLIIEPSDIEKAAEIASDEVEFGSDMKGSKDYRKGLCKTLVKRALLEVIK